LAIGWFGVDEFLDADFLVEGAVFLDGADFLVIGLSS
jgi:hypothetical protein